MSTRIQTNTLRALQWRPNRSSLRPWRSSWSPRTTRNPSSPPALSLALPRSLVVLATTSSFNCGKETNTSQAIASPCENSSSRTSSARFSTYAASSSLSTSSFWRYCLPPPPGRIATATGARGGGFPSRSRWSLRVPWSLRCRWDCSGSREWRSCWRLTKALTARWQCACRSSGLKARALICPWSHWMSRVWRAPVLPSSCGCCGGARGISSLCASPESLWSWFQLPDSYFVAERWKVLILFCCFLIILSVCSDLITVQKWIIYLQNMSIVVVYQWYHHQSRWDFFFFLTV